MNLTIYNKDFFEYNLLIEDNSIDLIVTSPPYNFEMNYDNYNDKNTWGDYFKKMKIFSDICYRIIKPGGRIAINIQPLFSDFIPSHHIISELFRESGFLWRNEILWEKNNYNSKYTTWGSWKSASNPYFKYTWEFIEVFSKNQNGKKEKGISDISADEFKEWVVAKWSIAPERKMKEYGHPAMFPIEIPRRLVKLYSYVGDTVLDPFMGLGTTGLACKGSRNFIGFDLSEEYCCKAIDRISKHNP